MKKKKLDLDKWEEWKAFALSDVERAIKNGTIDYIDLNITYKDGSKSYLSWFEKITNDNNN